MVHGTEEAGKARKAAKALFAGGVGDENMPTTTLTAAQLDNGRIGILTLMTICGLSKSNGEARRLVQQGGVFVDDQKVDAPDVSFTEEQLREGLKLRKGKKIYHKAIL